MNFLLLVEVQRHALVRHDLFDQPRDRLARLARVHTRQLLQIQSRDQRAMNFRFVSFQI